MKQLLFAVVVAATGCSIARDTPMSVTPAIMKVKHGHISFVKTGPAMILNDSLDGKAAFIISKSAGPFRLTRF